MGLFDRFTSGRAAAKKDTANTESLSGYTGLRVEVFNTMGQMLFVASLFVRSTSTAELRQFSNSAPLPPETSIPVTMRGYDDRQKLAIHFRGTISQTGERIWQVENLTLTGKDNDRAFFRQAVSSTGEIVLLGWVGVQNPKPCEVRNISAGGVCLQMRELYQIGSRFQLRFELIRGREMPLLRCQILRVTVRQRGVYEYGCKFIDMPPGTEDKIAKAIMDLQMLNLSADRR